MSFPMTHMQVAYKLRCPLVWIERTGDFILGSIAPDAVHFREQYDASMKEASHLWNCGPRWGITTDSKRWKENIVLFWERHKGDANRDFIAGYCVHILTDWLNDLRIWTPFREAKKADLSNLEEFYKQYAKEAFRSDQWLHQISGDREAIWKALSNGRGSTIQGCVTAKDIERQQKSVLTEQFAGGEIYDISNHKFLTEAVLNAFIEESVDMLSSMLIL